MAARLSQARFALLAAGNMKGSHGCWETNDVPAVGALLRSWRRQHKLTSTPLVLLGPSSGGWFITQAARQWADVRALSVQISVPSSNDVQAPLPSGAAAYPPLQLVLMQRDTGKLREAEALRQHVSETIVEAPRPLGATFFSDGMPGLSPDVSRAVRDGLVAAGHVDAATLLIKKHPSRGSWRDPVRAAIEAATHGKNAALLPQGSLQVAMDGIFARLDLAYAYHASTCFVVERTLAFFERLSLIHI